MGCSGLAVVLMTHHFISFCRKNEAWDAVSRAASQLSARVRGGDQDRGDSGNTNSSDFLPVSSLLKDASSFITQSNPL